MSAKFVSSKDETVRLFKSDFFEFFSRVHPSVPVILYLPLVVYLLYRAATNPLLSVSGIIMLFLAGWLAWTATDYLLHRFVFHFEPKGEFQKSIFYLFHGIHHDYPNDSWRLVMPPAVSIPLAVIFYAAFYWLIGKPHHEPFFAGFVFGYLCYDMIHYAVHHFPMNKGLALYLRQYHIRHHFQDETRSFGVSSPLWDYVLGTTPEKKRSEARPVEEISPTSKN
jgi:sterol desaturase/sphingolipid hydroxylase (fatty acid hydroxylase superfamily)